MKSGNSGALSVPANYPYWHTRTTPAMTDTLPLGATKEVIHGGKETRGGPETTCPYTSPATTPSNRSTSLRLLNIPTAALSSSPSSWKVTATPASARAAASVS